MRFLIFLLINLVFFSCRKAEIDTSAINQYDKISSVIKQQISELKDSGQRYSKYATTQCNVDTSQNCTQILQEIEIDVDIRECSTSVLETCEVLAEMLITICVNENISSGEDVVVTFEETVFGHDASCIIDQYEHTDDFECIIETTYLTYVDYFMPIILETWLENSDCRDSYNTFLSRYNKELCVYPCTKTQRGWTVVEFVACGESTACCLKQDMWCKNSDGTIEVTPDELVMVGECSPGEVPCRKSQSGIFPWLNECLPRHCVKYVND